ncbi:MAG: hypothetical protein IKX86_01620 [Clostridia bacterium]|nr:hypothetical protein [Clostridia bacterium]MBR5767363.1 hypothetical protein [Clostridia bacterium]
MSKIRAFFSRFFAGRHGLDDLGRLNLWMIALFCLVQCIGYVVKSAFLVVFSRVVYIILAVLFFFRLLSRNEVRRSAENNGYLKIVRKIRDSLVLLKNRIRDRRTHIYRKCPECSATLRLKRIKGVHRAACPRCGNSFEVNVR